MPTSLEDGVSSADTERDSSEHDRISELESSPQTDDTSGHLSDPDDLSQPDAPMVRTSKRVRQGKRRFDPSVFTARPITKRALPAVA